MAKDAEQILRLMDTSGLAVPVGKCFYCSAKYTPDPEKDIGLCPSCIARGMGKHLDKVPDLRDKFEDALRCLLCAEVYEVTPSIGKVDQLCPKCRNGLNGTAKLVCAKCNVTICRIAPTVIEGYIVRPNAILHSDRCNICSPGLTESKIVEIDLWIQTQKPKKTFVGLGKCNLSADRRPRK